jgi:hypothetical protein
VAGYTERLPDEPDYRPDRTSGLVYGRLKADRNAIGLIVPGLGIVFISTQRRRLTLSIATDAEIRGEAA